MFLENPSDLISPVENAWKECVAAGEDVYRQVTDRVQQWRFAPEPWHYVPVHPFAHLFDVGDYSPWRPRPIRYVDASEEDTSVIRHGVDAEGRVVVAGRRLVVYGVHFHDLLVAHDERSPKTFEFTGRRLVFEAERGTGFPKGRITRYLTSHDGRIEASVRLSDEGQEPRYHYRIVETFRWDGDRLVESFAQWFLRRPGEEDDDASKVRRVDDQLCELLYMRRRTEYTYDDSGRLARVAEYTADGQPQEVRYTYNPDDTVKSVSDELVKLLERHLVKAIKAVKQARPIHWAALQYSAEHAHCGLPTQVLLSADGAIDPLDLEAYSHQAAWPPTGRVGQKYDELQRRLQLVVEGLPEYADDFQPRPYREVLWRASHRVYDTLSGKRITAKGFAVFPTDDHGDVDPAEDVRQSLPADVAERVTRQVTSAAE